jgi:putative protease
LNPTPHRRPELLSPAGDLDCVRAAVENGADAVYFGLENGFNARARATNLHIDSLGEVMAMLHERGVKGFVTLNTLVFPSELHAVETAIVALTAAGVDAVLVQDLGLVRLIRAMSPDLAIHASTQMTLTSSECIAVAAELGIERVVLARELSIREISKIRANTDIELETFVHGALCVAYSGQCLTSESLGGRSANRGQCAQACRLPYDLICDGNDVPLGDVKYLLSPQDLAAYDLVPQLLAAGVDCLKIEGRLKTPEYVAGVTRHYRQAIDQAAAGVIARYTRQEIDDLEMTFSRGFSPGWLEGCDHKMLVPGLSSAKRGVHVGKIVRIEGHRVVARLTRPLKPGDGIVFEGNREQGTEQGGRVYETTAHGELTTLGFGRGAIDFGHLRPGLSIWKTDDPQLTARLQRTFNTADPERRVPLDLVVTAMAGQPLRIEARADNGASCTIVSQEICEIARKHALTADVLQTQLGRLGASVYVLRDLRAEIRDQVMVPLSVLGKLRRALLESLRLSQPDRLIRPAARPATMNRGLESDAPTVRAPRLHVLCRQLSQVEAMLEVATGELYADFQDIRQYRQAIELARTAGKRLLIATPRIQKPDEVGIFRVMARWNPDGFVARNLAGIGFCREQQIDFVSDFSLNAANQYTVDYLRSQEARRVTLSYDLNRDQLIEVVEAAGARQLEVVVHQHMPMFHMEHCVFCAVLSPGTNKTNCGRPCDTHQVKLRDRVGMEHPLTADVGCRNTLFNAVPQSAAEAVPHLMELGLVEFRVELLDDSPQQAQRIVSLYRRLLAGDLPAADVWRQLKAANRVGVTRGTLEERRNPLAIL